MLHHNVNRHGEPDWGVVLCECGVYRVRLGSVVLELERQDFLRLQHLLTRAAEHFGMQDADQDAAPSESRRHQFTH